MSKKGELLINDQEAVIVNFKLPSRDKHGRTDWNLVDFSAEIRTGYPSIHPRNAFYKEGNLCGILGAHILISVSMKIQVFMFWNEE
jgi:hypothetical protein